MRRPNPEQCTVLIARTGKAPVTLLVHPRFALLAVLASILTPLAVLGGTIYSLQQRNATLTEQNTELSETATEVIQELEILDDEISDLRERAGMEERSASESELQSDNRSRGGVSTQIETSELLAIAQDRIPLLSARLYGHVKPALTEILDAEEAQRAARPKGRPVKSITEVSSYYGLRRNPFGWGYEFHDGIDFTGPQGTPIYATAPGIVETAEYQRGYGYHVIVDHGYGYKTLYAHLSDMAVMTGDTVSKDQIIGNLGSTGRSTGPHLHYSVYRDGEPVDPIGYIH